MINLGEQIRQSGITHQEVADAMGVSRQYISAFLAGDTDNIKLEIRIKKWLQKRKT